MPYSDTYPSSNRTQGAFGSFCTSVPSKFHTLTGETITPSTSQNVSIFPNVQNIVLNMCSFVAAPGGSVNMPSNYLDYNEAKQDESLSATQPPTQQRECAIESESGMVNYIY